MIVVDTNVLAYLLLPAPMTAAAENLFIAVAQDLGTHLFTADRGLRTAFPDIARALPTGD